MLLCHESGRECVKQIKLNRTKMNAGGKRRQQMTRLTKKKKYITVR